MTAAVLERPATIMFSSGFDGFKPKCTFSKADNGKNVLTVTDMPVFRSGTFADSTGEVRTWDSFQMSQMANNFNYLKNNGTFAKVPVKRGHGGLLSDPMDALIGWHFSLSSKDMISPADGQNYTYAVADFSIFDEEAQQNIADGNWPNRSAEIGTYVNNAGSEYFPAYLGFAYVVTPAVEGLNFAKAELAKKSTDRYTILVSNPKEFGMADNDIPDPLSAGTGTPPAGGAPEGTPPVIQHSAPANAHVFSIGGQSSSDFAAVQRYIDGLETFQRETSTAARANFVSSLASGENPRILQATVEGLQDMVKDFSDSQYAKFKATYEAMPAMSLTAQHGGDTANNSGDSNNAGGPVDAAKDRIAVLEGIVAHHKNGGIMSPEQIKQTGSYVELQRLLAANK